MQLHILTLHNHIYCRSHSMGVTGKYHLVLGEPIATYLQGKRTYPHYQLFITLTLFPYACY